MMHRCHRSNRTKSAYDGGFRHDDDPCKCECDPCKEWKRMHALKTLTHDQLDAVWEMMMEMGVTGPWKATQLEGFGAARFIVNEKAPHFKIVAELRSGIGSFAGDQFVAWCRDGVPRLLLTLQKVMPSIEQTRADIKDVGSHCRMYSVTREGFVEHLVGKLTAAGVPEAGRKMHYKMFQIPGTAACDTESCCTMLDEEFGAKAVEAALGFLPKEESDEE